MVFIFIVKKYLKNLGVIVNNNIYKRPLKNKELIGLGIQAVFWTCVASGENSTPSGHMTMVPFDYPTGIVNRQLNCDFIKDVVKSVNPNNNEEITFRTICRNSWLRDKLNALALRHKRETKLFYVLSTPPFCVKGLSSEESYLCFSFNYNNPFIKQNYPALDEALTFFYNEQKKLF